MQSLKEESLILLENVGNLLLEAISVVYQKKKMKGFQNSRRL